MFIDGDLTRVIIGGAIKVHRALGPGLLESVYEKCLAHELCNQGCRVVRQKVVPITYEGVRIAEGYRIDLEVNERVIVEIKSIQRMQEVFEAQLMTYLRLSNRPVGLLINFNVSRLSDGITRRVMTR